MQKVLIKDNFYKLVSSTGYFAKADRTATYEGDIYLGIYDNESNYIEITEAEKQAIDKEIEDRYEAERIARENEIEGEQL